MLCMKKLNIKIKYMAKNLPIIIQNIVYRISNKLPEVLLLKRTEKRGGFWNVVNGTLEMNETIVECRNRELYEEAGIKDVLGWSDEIYRFSFKYNDYVIVVLVYSVKVAENQEVVINEEHDGYQWMSFDDAINMMKFNDDKLALSNCYRMILKENSDNTLTN